VFVLTLLIAATINFTVGELLTSRSPLLALVVGYLLYLIIGKVADLNGFFNLKKLFTARIYYLLLILALAYGLFYFYGKGDLIERYLPTLRGQENLFSGGKAETEIPPSINDNTSLFSTGDYIYEGTGEVISNPPEITTGAQQGSGTTVETEGNTGSTIPTPNETTPTAEENTPHTGTVVTAKNITMLEALKHVITTNQLPLSSKTDINFTSISKNNADYPYFKTAYETRMIGKNTDPSKQISCDTYIVIKGIGEGRNVGNYTDVKAAYWKKAEELGKLNGCQKGAWVTTTTL
jgi:hypothetical protein